MMVENWRDVRMIENYEVYRQTETEYNYDNLVEEIVQRYDVRIKLNPPIQNMSVNQTTLSKKGSNSNKQSITSN